MEGADERQKSMRFWEENTPKKDKAMVEEVVANGGKNKDKSSSEKSEETEECIQQHPTLQEAARAEQGGPGEKQSTVTFCTC